MAFQPILSKTIPNMGEIRMHTQYSNKFFDMEKEIAQNTHIHSCYEIYLNLSGDISFFHNGKIYDIQAGDILISHPADIHYCIYHSSCVHEHYCMWFVNDFISDFIAKHDIRGRIRLSKYKKERLINLISSLHFDDLESIYKLENLIELITLIDYNILL